MLRRGGTFAAALALAALLGLPPDPGLGSLWSRIALWMEELTPWSVTTAADCDDGLMIDPDGCPRGQADDGWSIDPNGQPAPAPDDGPMIDPDG